MSIGSLSRLRTAVTVQPVNSAAQRAQRTRVTRSQRHNHTLLSDPSGSQVIQTA